MPIEADVPTLQRSLRGKEGLIVDPDSPMRRFRLRLVVDELRDDGWHRQPDTLCTLRFEVNRDEVEHHRDEFFVHALEAISVACRDKQTIANLIETWKRS